MSSSQPQGAVLAASALITRTPLLRIVSSVGFSPGGSSVACGEIRPNEMSRVVLWETDTGEVRHTLQGHFNNVDSVAFSPDGKTLASSGRGVVKTWDVTMGKEVRTWMPASGVGSMAFGG
jgi:WD40 repeat protein